LRAAHKSLLADMREAMLAELGAHAVYGALAARVGDEELARILARFRQDELEQVERLREVMRSLGGRPPRRSLRRRLAARLLVASTRLIGPRFALRVCLEAESAVSRWYREYAVHLVRVGELPEARACEELSQVKARHARVLGAWVELLPPRNG
jgi:rubrerythrin